MSVNYRKDEVQPTIEALNVFLADTAVVYYKTHAFHWNLEGSNFYGLHLMFEKFYTKLWKSMDEIAERVRALEGKAPANFTELLKRATISETEGVPEMDDMIKILRNDYFALAQKAYEVRAIASSQKDLITEDMIILKATFLEKAAWMLHSSLMK